MSIALFIIFLFMNFFILLIMKFVYTSNYSYTEGMLLGVHIPKEHSEDETVLNIVADARRKMNRIIWINLILGTALCFVVFWEIIIFVLAYTIWMIAFCFLITYANNSAHRKMYALKMKNDWIIPAQKRKRYIDTNVSALIGNSEISFNYHGIIILVELICLLPFAIGKSAVISTTMIIMGLCSVLMSLTSMIFHIYVNRHERTVYSSDTQLNQTVNRTMKIYKGLAMLILSATNAVAWVYIAIDTLIHCISSANKSRQISLSDILNFKGALVDVSLCSSALYVYIFIQTLAADCLRLSSCLKAENVNSWQPTPSLSTWMTTNTGKPDITTILPTRMCWFRTDCKVEIIHLTMPPGAQRFLQDLHVSLSPPASSG